MHPGIGSIMGNGVTTRVSTDQARIADVWRRIRAWLALRVKPLERRWIPDPAERERHETIVVRRLEPQTEKVDAAQYS